MKTSIAIGTAALMMAVALSGCFGNGTDTTRPDELDESAFYDWAIANNGYRVRGDVAGGERVPLIQTPDGSASAVDLKVVNNVDRDAAGPEDKADFLMDAQVQDGSRYQATIRSIMTGRAAGLDADFGGGVSQNVQVFGGTGLGPTVFPETKAYLLVFGQSRVRVDGEFLDGRHAFMAMVTRAVHGPDGQILDTPSDASLELHVYFPGRTLGSDFAIPGQTDAFLYFYFTNVRLRELSPDERGNVGAGLVPPEVPNQPPVAVARVLIEGEPAGRGTINVRENEGNLTVVLDGSQSSDPDGNVTRYSWRVQEFANATAFADVFSGLGEQVTMNFTAVGWYQVTLRVIDDRLDSAEDSLLFFVDYKNQFAWAFDGANSVGGGTDCNDPINCKDHQVSLRFGAQEATFTLNRGDATRCQTPTLRLEAPDGTALGTQSGTSLTVTGAEKFENLGAYKLWVWFQAQAQCSYTVDAAIIYTPPEALESPEA